MFFQLTGYTKRKVISALREFWANQPGYDFLVDNIQGKYSFKERPHHAIIVKAGGGDPVMLAADNKIGVMKSRVFLARVPNYLGASALWVREDNLAIGTGKFPSKPGAYFCEITGPNQMHVDPLYDAPRERVRPVNQRATLRYLPVARTLRIFELPSERRLESTEYSLNEENGELTFSEEFPSQVSLYAEYKYQGESTGPWPLKPLHAVNKPIPGVVLAFGNKIPVGDRFAVVITEDAQENYDVFGGQWEITLDIDVVATDVNEQEEIADRTAVFLLGILRTQLADEGVELSRVSLGGESEEIRDETGDDYFYNSSMSVSLTTNWELYVPRPISLKSFSASVQQMTSILELRPYRDPFFKSARGFEVII